MTLQPRPGRFFEAFFLLLCAVILAWQLLLPGFIGMANNGDFPKVAGPLCMQGTDHETEKFDYFQPNYLRGPDYCYNPHIPSSEILPARFASWLGRVRGDKQHFDIRWLGGVHALLFLGIYFLLLVVLRPLHPAARAALSLAALWIFADAGFVAYLNTFYSDVPAMLGGLAAIFLAILLVRGESIHLSLLALFGLAALFFITSKAQHGLYGFIPIAAAIWFGRQSQARGRVVAGLIAVSLAGGMIWVLGRTPGWYTAQSRFNLIFSKIAFRSTTPAQDIKELGLDDSDARYTGMHAYMPNTPMLDAAYRERFYARTSYWKAVLFYLRHPGRAFQLMLFDVRTEAPVRRLYGNFPKSYGLPPLAQTKRFASWSSLRIQLFVWWREHIIVWYGLLGLGLPWLAIVEKSRFGKALLWTTLAVTLAGAGEFSVSSLADGAETARHLWMFHVFTDVTIFLVLVFAASKWKGTRPVSAAIV